MSVPARFLQALCPECDVSSNNVLSSSKYWGAAKGNSNRLHCFGSLLDAPHQQLKEDVSHDWHWGFC